MLYATFALAHKSNACTESYKKMGEALGGITKYGKDTPIPLDTVVEVCGLQDAIWSLRCTTEDSQNLLIEFACRCAEHVLHFYEDKYPGDNRPRLAIEAARVCLTDKSPNAWSARSAAESAAESAAWSAAWSARSAAESAAWSAAGSAAWSAAGSAAESAAWSAAESAAESAEQEWQKQQFLELLNK